MTEPLPDYEHDGAHAEHIGHLHRLIVAPLRTLWPLLADNPPRQHTFVLDGFKVTIEKLEPRRRLPFVQSLQERRRAH